ncbi:hypothetical protein JOY44_27000 (plasmid) [Phormidium sp. CLA17]|uniref:hypothetical protein n=1 Tax=Leptolyngbya sp. Cla-17 TaxID=2803751 RepID=UPI0014911B7C|nr:hypothetical protein [Leptolyngbya sp. Cla-17]MBM0744747.1 hypothetical protein [Leptolyngbya sp. Cla-17]MBM0744748.1 hypothetical protein [Leptolyngbya sp. Cla-17]MBM0745137.1 hypothetical protein [Leptolyngbya sp. Cla-17]
MITGTATTQIATVTDFLRQSSLTADEQYAIDHAIGLVALERRWTRQRAALWINKLAFPELY